MDSRHRDHNAKRNKHAAYSARKKLYDSAEWKRVRAHILTERVLCELCKAQGRVVPGVEVHHIADLADGGAPFDADNLQLLCTSCHSIITKTHRIKGCAADGSPLDPNHHWHRT
jgi:5-methylcytosine-specific restriction endonuclease McrA